MYTVNPPLPPVDDTDISGLQFGLLTALYPTTDVDVDGVSREWRCRCKCGAYAKISMRLLMDGTVTSCGCEGSGVGPLSEDITGKRHGMLEALMPVHPRDYTEFIVRCECGRMRRMSTEMFMQRGVTSCGCVALSLKQGGPDIRHCPHHPLRAVHRTMMNKCYSEGYVRRALYEGIEVCEEWHDYHTFYDWAYANGWEPGKALSRIDAEGPYSPENCDWVELREASKRKKEKPNRTPRTRKRSCRRPKDTVGIEPDLKHE